MKRSTRYMPRMTNQIFDSREFRSALGRFATGVSVVTAIADGKTHAMTANAFVSVSLNPPLVLVSVDNRSNMHRILPAAQRYGVSVLAENQRTLSDYFAARAAGRVEVRFISRAHTALLPGAVAYVAAKVVDAHPAGDHTLYIGLVEYCECREDKPLLFYAGKYHQLHV
jgi:flavin reductase (DIM6/NTAB) family NADH-FMN oxidoreductase RutF